jgi:pimeloyl-ACP methyl ester carboxylesterase
VIVVSQRGIGSSKPNTIVETTLPLQPPDQPFDDALAEKRLKEILIREKATWEKLGVDLKGFTIIEAAADIDEVRKALGYRKIVLWGGSFGSHWGMAVMRYYPEIVARAIFRGMEGPDHTYDHPGHLWNVYKRVAEDAENSKVFKDRIPEGGLIKAIETVINRVDEKPFTLRSTDPNTGVSYNVLFDSSTIRRLARGYSSGLRGWPADVISMYEGDFTEAARQIVDRYLRPSRNYRTASYYMLDCGSGITATRLKAYDDDPATFILNRMNWGYRSGCTVWESDLGDAFRQNFKTDIPAVIVHGTWDTSTPYENALELVPFFTNSKFIPVIRGPHGSIRAALRESEQFTSGIMRFAATGDMSGLPDQVELKPRSWILPEHMKSKGN